MFFWTNGNNITLPFQIDVRGTQVLPAGLYIPGPSFIRTMKEAQIKSLNQGPTEIDREVLNKYINEEREELQEKPIPEILEHFKGYIWDSNYNDYDKTRDVHWGDQYRAFGPSSWGSSWDKLKNPAQ